MRASKQLSLWLKKEGPKIKTRKMRAMVNFFEEELRKRRLEYERVACGTHCWTSCCWLEDSNALAHECVFAFNDCRFDGRPCCDKKTIVDNVSFEKAEQSWQMHKPEIYNAIMEEAEQEEIERRERRRLMFTGRRK